MQQSHLPSKFLPGGLHMEINNWIVGQVTTASTVPDTHRLYYFCMKRFFFFLCLFFVFAPNVHAESLAIEKTTTQIRAEITDIKSVSPVSSAMNSYEFRAKSETGEFFDVRTEDSIPVGIPIKLTVGKKIFLQKINSDPPQVYFEDVVRTGALWWIAIIFITLSLAVGLKRGFWSLIGLGVTFLVLFGFIFPRIMQGQDVLIVTIIGSVVILAVNMHIAHGFRRESFLAFISTVIGLFCIWFFANIFTAWTSITGTGSEDVMLLVGDAPIEILTIRLFLAGVILGAVGVLDDVAVSQTEIIHELVKTNPQLTRKQLFFAAMRIGRHHIASTINTLVLVYAGASMPVLILFLYHSGDVSSFLNSEVITEEIVRTFAGTAALILTVPIATFIATYGYSHRTLDTPNKHA